MKPASPRVAHIVGGSGGMGGAERVVAEIVNAARPGTHRVLFPFAAIEDVDEFVAAVPPSTVSAHATFRPADVAKARSWLARELDAGPFEIMHSHLAHASVLVATLRRGQPPRLLTHHHGWLFQDDGRRLASRVDRWATRRYDSVVAVSNAVAVFLEHRYTIDPAGIEVIPNGWTGQPLERRAGGPDFVVVGRLRREKGHYDLLRAFSLVRLELPDAGLRIVGDGPLRTELETLVAQLRLGSSVEFVGAVRDVWPHLAEASVVVVPSRTETQGIVVLEAMAAGCPIVATSVGGIPEMIHHGRDGHLVPASDIRAMADAMILLRRDVDRAQAYAREGRRTAQDWRMQRTTERYLALYRRLWA